MNEKTNDRGTREIKKLSFLFKMNKKRKGT